MQKRFGIGIQHSAWLLCVSLVAAGVQGADTLSEMTKLASSTKVLSVSDGTRQTAVLVSQPIFRYSDPPRRIFDATLWAWTVNGRPIAFQKIESGVYVQSDDPRWTYCLASFCEHNIEVEWEDGHSYKSTQPGITYRPVPNSPFVASKLSLRRRQMKELASSFDATITIDADGKDVQEMRLLPKPIMEYTITGSSLPTGAVFGLTSNGTNPDAYLVIDLREGKAGQLEWHYGAARMTICKIELRHKDNVVWTQQWVRPVPTAFDTWTFYYAPKLSK